MNANHSPAFSSRFRFFTRMALLLLVFVLCGCSELGRARRAMSGVDPVLLRKEVLAVCREGFAAGGVQEIPKAQWPESMKAFAVLNLLAEPDGAYLLLHSDMDGERGVYLPRILTEKDPLCTPVLTHVKLAEGVYWFDRKRA